MLYKIVNTVFMSYSGDVNVGVISQIFVHFVTYLWGIALHEFRLMMNSVIVI